MKNTCSYLFFLLFGFTALCWAGTADTSGVRAYSDKGADICLKCHDEDWDTPILPIFKNKHGEMGDPRSPMARLQCETCHGPLGTHNKKVKRGGKRVRMIAFGKDSWVSAADQNKICLQCHDNHPRMNWAGSSHELQGMACAECHTLHAEKDPVLTPNQSDICFRCHQKQRAEFNRTSSHPLRQHKMRCTQCHNPHGTYSEKLLKQRKNQVCYECHTEKRGPYLWTHAPVSEDCGYCHEAHGSMYPAMLKRRPPLLCQQCHEPAGHPSVRRDGGAVVGGDLTNSRYLIGKSCLHCHSQVHGSNHPSGVKLSR